MSEKVGQIYFDVTLDTSKVIDGSRVVTREVDKAASSFNAITAAVKLLAAAMAALKIMEMADELRLLSTRAEVAAGSIEDGAAAMNDLVAVSRRTQTSLAGNVEVFTRLNQSIIAMGGAQRDTLQVTELLAKAVKVSGASAVEAKAAMLQFGQALGSGKLQGDELRSLMETAPYLMRQMAEGIGVPVGALKKLGEEGKLTADVVVNALTKAAAKIEADFEKFPQTIDSALTVARDSAALAALKFDELTGGSAALAGATKGLAQVLDELGKQLGAANEQAGGLGRNDAVKTWAEQTKIALSYVVDAADMVWQTLSVLGRNVAFVFKGIGTEIGGIGAQVAAVLRGDFAQAKAIGEMMESDAAERRRALDAADKATLDRAQLAGQQMREAWERGAAGYGRGLINPAMGGTKKLKAPADDDAARKLAARKEAAQAYYQGLVAENAIASAKIDAEERKALADNSKRQAEDKDNAGIYAKAKQEIIKRFARERAQLEEKTTQEVADLNIAITSDELQKINAIEAEALRRADASVKLGVKTVAEAEREKTLATFTAQQQRIAINERLTQTNADTVIAATADELTKIDLIRQESFRRADAAARQGAITYAQAEADKARAAVEAQNAIRQQVLSINPLAQLEKEYQDKLAIVQFYEQQMAQAGVDGATFLEQKRAELATQFRNQRLALAEAEFAAQSEGNAFLIGSLNSLNSAATSSITGLITGTLTAQEAMRGLANVVLNEAVGSLVQIGVQYLKNALIGQAAEKAMMATKAANAALYTTAVSAQVGVTTALAAQNAFMATAAIPIVGPALAPAAAAAAAGVAGALGAPAVAAAPLAGARQYGGPVSAGSLYRVNETGRPEMFTASNGSQYMMPTANGSVTPADKVGGGLQVNVQVINQHPTAQVTQRTGEGGQVQLVVSEVARQFRENDGPIWEAARSSTNIASRL